MKKTTSVKWGSLKVGLLLAFAVGVMLWASLSGAGTSIFDAKGKIVCYFGNVSGLVSGAPVWMAGVEVGNVKSIKFVSLDEFITEPTDRTVQQRHRPLAVSGVRAADPRIPYS